MLAYFSNRNSFSPRSQRTLFIQLIYYCFTRHHVPANYFASFSAYKHPIRSDEGLTLKISVLKLKSGQFTLSTDLGDKTIIVSLFVEVTSAVLFFCPDARVLLLICGSSFLTKQDEERVKKVVKNFVNETEKIVTGWLKPGIINLELDELVQLLTSSPDVTQRGPNQGNSPEWGLQRETDRQVQTQQPREATANYPATREQAHLETVILRCWLYRGKNLQSEHDLLSKIHDFELVNSIYANLFEKYKTIALALVKFFIDAYGFLRYTVEIKRAEDPNEEGIEMAEDETLMLSTLVRYGNVSSKKCDVQFHREGFEIPPDITEKIKGNYGAYRKVSLYVVRDEKGQLRYKYITGVVNETLGKINEVVRYVKNYRKT